jgi:signal transduction histidine kinase
MTMADLLLFTTGLSAYLAASSGLTWVTLHRHQRLPLLQCLWSTASFVYQLARWRQETSTERLHQSDWWCLAMGIVLVVLLVHVVAELTQEPRWPWLPRAYVVLAGLVLAVHASSELFITHGVSHYVNFTGREVPFSTVGPLYLPVMLAASLLAGAWGLPAFWRAPTLSRREKAVWLSAGVACLAMGGNDLLMFSHLTTGVLPGLPGQSLFEFGVVGFAVVFALRMAWRTEAMTAQLRELSASLTKANLGLEVAVDEARRAAQMKGEFLANMSHELRTPLNAIINIPEGLLEDFHQAPDDTTTYDGDPARTRKYLEAIGRSGQHLLGVVNQVLDFSKLDAGRMTLQLGPVSVRQVLSDTVTTLSAMASAQQVTLTLAGPLDGQLVADLVKVSQVLLNLGSNALKHSPEGSVVTLTVEEHPEAIAFRVRDEGPGIEAAHQARIFEGFQQVETGYTKRFGGTGLGLTISRRLAELHGGSLTVESAPGAGSTFIATFPRTAEPTGERP